MNGTITEERLSDAVHRVPGPKAKLNLFKPENIFKSEEGLAVIGCEEHTALCAKAADACTTLVKDTQKLLPLPKAEGKRAHLVYAFSKPESVHWKHDPIQDMVKEEIERMKVAQTDEGIDLQAQVDGLVRLMASCRSGAVKVMDVKNTCSFMGTCGFIA